MPHPHETWGAEAALAAVAIDHRRLHSGQLVPSLQTFDGDDVLAVQLIDESNASIYCVVLETLGRRFTEEYRTRAAILFRARDARAYESPAVTAKIAGKRKPSRRAANRLVWPLIEKPS